ncbi:hypothetical protein ACFYXH_40560 [Streptomyces sp. NPDC002730]|uniref:hypothetical protein n=1 Tax=Streptomyces sp. NPDC002730 TaxID=3364662 RepID=UPI0036763EDC
MTLTDRTSNEPSRDARLLAWLAALTGLLSVVAVVFLALTGHTKEAAIVGGAVCAAGGIRVTVVIRR